MLENYIKGILTTYTILFLGYSYNDIDIKHIVKWIQNHSSSRPPMFITSFEENESQRRYLENYNITTLTLKQETKNLNIKYSSYTKKLHCFIDMINRKSTSYNVSSDEDIINFDYNKLIVLNDLQAILFNQLEKVLTNCEIVFRESEPALIFSKDLLRLDYDQDLQAIYYKILDILKIRILCNKDINKIIDDEPIIINILRIFYKTGVKRVILLRELADHEEYFDLSPYFPTDDDAFFDNLINLNYEVPDSIDIINKKMNEAFILYRKKEYNKALLLIEDIISNCRTRKIWPLLFIAMFNKNIIIWHLKYDIFMERNNMQLKEYDLRKEYENLPRETQVVVEPVYDFLEFNLIYRLFFCVAKDLNLKEGYVKTIRSGGIVFGSDGGKNYCQLENLLNFVLKNRIMIESYQEYCTIHRTIMTIRFTEQELSNNILLNRLELFVLIKYLNAKELMALLSVYFPKEGETTKQFLISEEDKNWLVYEILANLSIQYTQSEWKNRDDICLINISIILSIVKFEEPFIDIIINKLIDIISHPGNSYDIYLKIDFFLGIQHNLFSTRISNESLIKIINIVIHKIIAHEWNGFEYRAFTSNGLYSIFGYTKIQQVIFDNEKVIRQLVVELSDYENKEKMEIISSILLNIYNIATDSIKDIIKNFVLSINNVLEDEVNLPNETQTETQLQKQAEKGLRIGSAIIFELNLALINIKKLESPIIEKIENYLGRFLDGKYYDSFVAYISKLIIHLYERDKNDELLKICTLAKQILQQSSL